MLDLTGIGASSIYIEMQELHNTVELIRGAGAPQYCWANKRCRNSSSRTVEAVRSSEYVNIKWPYCTCPGMLNKAQTKDLSVLNSTLEFRNKHLTYVFISPSFPVWPFLIVEEQLSFMRVCTKLEHSVIRSNYQVCHWIATWKLT